MKYFIIIVIVIVIVFVLGGFFIVGSPQKERARQFDQQRINDLSSIQWQIINYWQAKSKLPKALEDLRDLIGGFVPPVDPETGDPYGYEIRGPLTFALCAVFNQKADDEEARLRGEPLGSARDKPLGSARGEQMIWDHPAGRHCFERIIDPDLYRPRGPEKPF